MAELVLAIERLPHGADLPLPAYASAGAAGLDLLAAAEVHLQPGRHAAVPTGIRLALPAGVEGQVGPRPGRAPGSPTSTPRARSTATTAARSRCC